MALKRLFWRTVYDYLARRVEDRSWTFMNYGYAPIEAAESPLSLAAEDEPERYHIQLYHHVASAVPLETKDVLEVGSGRGGGSSYICRTFSPASMTGMDLSPAAVELCRQRFDQPGLKFVQGGAEGMPFHSESFDAVVNVESSHCYPSFEAFVDEVGRVLRPGGHFLFADFRPAEEIEPMIESLTRYRLNLVSRRDITAEVLCSLKLDQARKAALIERFGVPLRKALDQFAGMEGTVIYEAFRSSRKVYVSCLLRKE